MSWWLPFRGLEDLLRDLAVMLSRTIERFLYGVAPTDATSYVLAAAFLMTIAVIASYVPARRATRIDPLTALRAE